MDMKRSARGALATLGLSMALVASVLTGVASATVRECSGAFTTVGSFDCVVPAGVASIDVLVVGGGGGGGGGFTGGGGGGGGEVKVCTVAVTPGQTLSGQVADGGVGGTGRLEDLSDQDGTDGGSSSLAECSAVGGVGGTGFRFTVEEGWGAGGASGNGNAGGIASPDFTDFPLNGGGGGGAGAVGADGRGSAENPPCAAGDGGAGLTPSALTTPGEFSNVTAVYGGGGGGGNGCDGRGGLGGSGGGGNGGATFPTAESYSGIDYAPDDPTAGTANLGGGGGGGGNNYVTGEGTGAAGGSGYVEIRVSSGAPTTPTTTTVTCTASVVYTGTPRQACSAVTKAGATTVASPAVSYTSNTNAGTATATASYAGSATYSASTGTKTFTITPAAALVVKPSSVTWTAGQPVPTQWFTTTGFKGSDSWASPGMTAPTCAVYADTAHLVPVTLNASTAPGSYYVFCKGAVVNGNYQGVSYYKDGSFKVIGLSVTSMKPVSGPTAGGTLVRISGTGFVAGTTVTIGGQPCTGVVVQSGGTAVDCVTAANSAGAADVVVTTPGGTRTLVKGFTYIAPAPLTVTGISPTYGSVKGGTKVHIYGTGFTNPISVTIGGVACTKIDPAYVTSKGGKEVDCYTGRRVAGLVDVVVTTSAGTVTLPLAYRYK